MDEKTLLHLYRSCYPDIARYIMNRDGTAEQAEEAFHAALGAMLQQMEKGAVIGDYGAYLFRSAWNAFLAERRHIARNERPQTNVQNAEMQGGGDPEDPEEHSSGQLFGNFRASHILEPGPGPDHQVDQKLLLEATEASMAELTKAQQSVLQLSFDPELDLDDEQIGLRLGVTKDYVRVARFRAMEKLRGRLQQRGFGFMM